MLTNRTFAFMLGAGYVLPVTTVGPESMLREVTGVAFFDPKADLSASRDVQMWLGQPESRAIESTLLSGQPASSSIPGVVLEHVPESFDLRAAQLLTDTTGIVLWRKAKSASWLQLLDQVRLVLDSVGTQPGEVGSAVALGDIPRLADALAEYLGGSVIIEDARFTVLGYSVDLAGNDSGRDAAILTRSMPGEWVRYLESQGVLNRLRTEDDAVEVDGGPFRARRRFIAPVRVDHRFGGVIWLAQGDAPLPVDAPERLRVAAIVAAPHLRRHSELVALERAARDAHVRALLSGAPVSRSDIEDLGLPRTAALALIAIRPADGSDLEERQKEQLQNAVTLSCRTMHARSAVSAIGNTVYCIVVPPHPDDGEIADLAEALLASCSRALRIPLHVAVVPRVGSLDDLPGSRQKVDMLLESLRRHERGRSRVISMPLAAACLLLDQFADVARDLQPMIQYTKINELREYDAAHGSEYARTLQTYLTSNGQIPQAARTLSLHPTSLRYRLRRISELFDIDLADPDERLLCLVLLRP